MMKFEIISVHTQSFRILIRILVGDHLVLSSL